MLTNVERKIDVKEFVRRYDMLKTDEQKEEFVKSIIWRTYCPILEKKVILQTMADKTIVRNENNVTYIDCFLQKVNMVTSILLLYTKLNISKDEDSETNAYDDYDMLFERDLLNKICAHIGERELKELMSVQGTILENYNAEHSSLEAQITKYINMFATTVGVFANEGANMLVEFLKDKGNLSDLTKLMK